MRFVKGTAVLLSISLVLAGCAKQTLVADSPRVGTPDSIQTSNFFLGGIGQEDAMDAADVCNGADRVAAVETEQTVVNGLLTLVTLGIYYPREMRVYCR